MELVGTGNISPEYFHERLTFHEARLLQDGIAKRSRPIYETARMLHSIIGTLFAKNYTMPKYPWDNENQKENEYTKEDIEKIQKRLAPDARAWEHRLNKKAQS